MISGPLADDIYKVRCRFKFAVYIGHWKEGGSIETQIIQLERILWGARLTIERFGLIAKANYTNFLRRIKMCKKMIYPIFFLVLVVGFSTVRAQGVEWDRALYWDDDYASAWAGGATTIRDALAAAGYTVLDADQLKTWMDGHIKDKALSVVVFCMDVVPDTVAETMNASCTIRKYLDSGGKAIWYSDWPFYYQGSSDGTNVTWGSAGATSVLGFNASSGPNDTMEEVVFTEAGIEWGLTTTWQSQRPTSVTITPNLTPLATISSGSAAAWVKHYVPGDKYRGFVRLYDTTGIPPSVEDIMRVAEYVATKAANPSPADGSILRDTWASVSWAPGAYATSHDVYMGENFDDVVAGTGETFYGNQAAPYLVVGFPGNPYPDGLVPGTTYYWRIDEVDSANTYKGDVWSFMIPPKTAFNPNPINGAELVNLEAELKWEPGFSAKLHTIFFGDNFDDVNDAVIGMPRGQTTYKPGALKLAKTYYWRVDEFEGPATHKGDVWSFTTQGGVGGPNPANGAVDVKPTIVLGWNAGSVAASHEVYFGADADAVRNATKTSPEYKGPKTLGDESYTSGQLNLATTYYWRIDEVNGINPDSPWAGNVWSFTTSDFFVIDDFEDYDAGDNQIWYTWHDGLGYGTPGTAGYFAGNGTGAAVGDETTTSYTEETIIHGGGQSMPVVYDNNKQGYSRYSEVDVKLSAVRNWTEEGVSELSLWFRGNPGSTGSFVEGPVGTYTMTASGADIWDIGPGAGEFHDEFHFAYKTLTGAGSIIARVDSVQNTNVWAKAGVMIRESLDPGSKHAFAAVTPGSGVASQGRPNTGAASFNTAQTGITAPRWVKLERNVSGLFTVSHSANGSTWQPVTGATPQNIPMGSNVYIGLAVTSHDAALTCRAVFSNVTTTGTVGQQWAHQDIGIASNAAEPLYVAVSNSTGTPAVMVYDDPAATQIDTWTEWVIPLQAFADQGIVLTNVDRIAIGLGTRGNTTIPGGSGIMFIDDIRLYKPADAVE